MSWLNDRARLQMMASEADISVRLVEKNSLFWRLLANILQVLRIMKANVFLDDFATTIGPIIAFPSNWSTETVENVLTHELVHVKQARACSFGLHPWIGLPIFAIAYLFLPIPFGLAYCRFHFELEAEKVRWYKMFKEQTNFVVIDSIAKNWAKLVSSSSYGWSMPTKWAIELTSEAIGKLFARYLSELPSGTSVENQ